MLRTRHPTKLAILEPKLRILARGKWKAWTCLCLAASFAVCMPVPTRADGVSGFVFWPDERRMVNATFTAKPASGSPVDFKTDGTGNFSIYLDPGRYTVQPKADPSMEGVIESYSRPVQQDIHLKKVKR